MPISAGQLSYWRNKTGNPNLTAGGASYLSSHAPANDWLGDT